MDNRAKNGHTVCEKRSTKRKGGDDMSKKSRDKKAKAAKSADMPVMPKGNADTAPSEAMQSRSKDASKGKTEKGAQG